MCATTRTDGKVENSYIGLHICDLILILSQDPHKSVRSYHCILEGVHGKVEY